MTNPLTLMTKPVTAPPLGAREVILADRTLQARSGLGDLGVEDIVLTPGEAGRLIVALTKLITEDPQLWELVTADVESYQRQRLASIKPGATVEEWLGI
jgi:hypothetical protein